MATPPSLPLGLVARPASQTDLAAVARLFEASDVTDRGEVIVTAEDIESGWNMPGWAIDEGSVMVFAGDDLLAYAEVFGWRAEAVVHPQARRQGIGSSLLAWTEAATLDLQTEGAEARIGQTIQDTQSDAIDLLVENGYTPRHTSWVLRLPREATIPDRPVPAGYVIRPYLGEEERHVFQVIEDSFNEWPNREPSTYEKWQARTTKRSDFDPALLYVAVHDGDVVGASVGLIYPDEGWVEQIAVRRDHRNRGLAQALLGTSFEAMRLLGLPDVGLSTDSRTGALDLYLKVGMVVRDSYTHYSKLLRPADIAVG